ncbi:hypothetical protein GGI35DRAFT_168416 [Trichoderma velutinum]
MEGKGRSFSATRLAHKTSFACTVTVPVLLVLISTTIQGSPADHVENNGNFMPLWRVEVCSQTLLGHNGRKGCYLIPRRSQLEPGLVPSSSSCRVPLLHISVLTGPSHSARVGGTVSIWIIYWEGQRLLCKWCRVTCVRKRERERDWCSHHKASLHDWAIIGFSIRIPLRRGKRIVNSLHEQCCKWLTGFIRIDERAFARQSLLFVNTLCRSLTADLFCLPLGSARLWQPS